MNIKPMSSPNQPPQNQPKAVDSRARAIAAFNASNSAPAPQPAPQSQPPPQVVQNQNAISPEELGAIQTPTPTEDPQQLDNIEETQLVTETPVEEPPKEDPALSRQFAQLARQEKALRLKQQQQDQALKAREAAITAKEAELLSKSQVDLSKYVPRDRIKQDILGVMAEEGIGYEDVTQQILTQQPENPRITATIKSLEAKIKALEDTAENSQKTYQEQQKSQYQAAVNQIKSDAQLLIKTDSTYEAIRATNSVNDVVELITQTYDKDGILLTIEEAANQVEDYLVEEAAKLAKLTKIQARLKAAQPKAQPPVQKPAQTPQQTQMKTLTNATAANRPLSARDRAIAAFKGEKI